MGVDNDPYRRLIEQFSKAFESEANKRPSYEGLEWIEAEIRFMTLEVLDELRILGIYATGVKEEVIRAEASARGHYDYGKKWAIGCADIVMRYKQYYNQERTQHGN